MVDEIVQMLLPPPSEEPPKNRTGKGFRQRPKSRSAKTFTMSVGPEPKAACYAKGCAVEDKMTIIMRGRAALLPEGWVFRKITFNNESIIVSLCPKDRGLGDAILMQIPQEELQKAIEESNKNLSLKPLTPETGPGSPTGVQAGSSPEGSNPPPGSKGAKDSPTS
jgi:hypothetical protein